MNNVQVRNLDVAMDLNGADALQALAVADAAVAVGGFHKNTRAVILNVAGADVRFTVDGTDPVGGTTGGLLLNGHHHTYHPQLVARMRFIRNASTSAVVTLIPVTPA